MRQFARALFFVLLAACFARAQSRLESLINVLHEYLGPPDAEIKTTEFAVTFADLRNDGAREAIVYLTSNGWCGTAGCTMLVLAPDGASYRVVSKIPAVRLPIRLLNTQANGWHDIGVVARKNGSEPLYESILRFDCTTYSNVSEGTELHGKVEGRVIMPATVNSKLLYP